MEFLRDLFGNLTSGIIRLVVTVGVLAAAYFFIVKPVLHTTENVSDTVNNSIESANESFEKSFGPALGSLEGDPQGQQAGSDPDHAVLPPGEDVRPAATRRSCCTASNARPVTSTGCSAARKSSDGPRGRRNGSGRGTRDLLREEPRPQHRLLGRRRGAARPGHRPGLRLPPGRVVRPAARSRARSAGWPRSPG